MNPIDLFDSARNGIGDPNHKLRNYDLSRMTALVGLLDNPMYPPYIEDTPHTHNCMEIGLCLSGYGEIAIGDREWRFSEGTVVVVPKDVVHAQQNMGERVTHWVYVLVDCQALLSETPRHQRDQAQKLLDEIRGGVYLGPEESSAKVRQVIEELFRVYRARQTLDGMEMNALTRLLISRLGGMPRNALASPPAYEPTRRAVEPALRFISDNYVHDIRVAELASACAMSESYFRKVFAETMGMSPVEYLNRYRVSRSIYLLHATDETVLTIAGLSGFASIASYNRNFLKYVGVSPGQWRKNARNT